MALSRIVCSRDIHRSTIIILPLVGTGTATVVIISSIITLLVMALSDFALVTKTSYHRVRLMLATVVCMWSAPYLRALHYVQVLQLTTFKRDGPDVTTLFDWTAHEVERTVLI